MVTLSVTQNSSMRHTARHCIQLYVVAFSIEYTHKKEIKVKFLKNLNKLAVALTWHKCTVVGCECSL